MYPENRKSNVIWTTSNKKYRHSLEENNQTSLFKEMSRTNLIFESTQIKYTLIL